MLTTNTNDDNIAIVQNSIPDISNTPETPQNPDRNPQNPGQPDQNPSEPQQQHTRYDWHYEQTHPNILETPSKPVTRNQKHPKTVTTMFVYIIFTYCFDYKMDYQIQISISNPNFKNTKTG
jgi:hypothetical protein